MESDAASWIFRFIVPRAQVLSVEYAALFLHPSELNKLEAWQRRYARVYSPISPRWTHFHDLYKKIGVDGHEVTTKGRVT